METEIKNYAPVVIPTLCRYEHFKRCIESLSRCTGAEHTEVYIGLDYPAKDAHWDGYNKIKDYLDSCGDLSFKKLIVIKRERNYGIGKDGNYCKLRDYIFEKYDMIISSEDDNEFSPCFLDYMNKCLIVFKSEKRVTSVGGYSLQEYSQFSKDNILFVKGVCAWGYGTWRDKYKEYAQLDTEYYKKILTNPLILFRFLLQSPLFLSGLALMLIKEESWGDYKSSCYNVKENCYQVRPRISLVRNWGFDGSGDHCNVNPSVSEREISKENVFDLPSDATIVVNENLNAYMKWDLLSRKPLIALKQLIKIPIFLSIFIIKNVFDVRK